MSLRLRGRRAEVLHPLDHRWGHNLNQRGAQVHLLWCLIYFGTTSLFVSPTCTPWSTNARTWHPEDRKIRRAEESLFLRFVALACLVQVLLGRVFAVENPAHSEIWQETDLALLRGGVARLYTCDQCMYGAKLEHGFAKKSTSFLCNRPLDDFMQRCDHTHEHQPLVGGTRTARSAVYPHALCESLVKALYNVSSEPVGGRLTFAGSPLGHHFNELKTAFDDLRIIAVSRGLEVVLGSPCLPMVSICVWPKGHSAACGCG